MHSGLQALEVFCEAALSNDYLDDSDCLSDRVVGVFSVEIRVERVQAGCREKKEKDGQGHQQDDRKKKAALSQVQYSFQNFI